MRWLWNATAQDSHHSYTHQTIQWPLVHRMGTSAYGEWDTILQASVCQVWKCQRWLAYWWYQMAMSSPLRWCHQGYFGLGSESTDFICRKAGWQTKSGRCLSVRKGWMLRSCRIGCIVIMRFQLVESSDLSETSWETRTFLWSLKALLFWGLIKCEYGFVSRH